MTLKVYNTLTKSKEVFQTLEPGKVSMYVCGPTVYDKAHVGHAMSSLVFDIIRRYLEHQNYEVRHIMNYTDVDDKIIQRANHLGQEPVKLAEKYIEEYGEHLEDLNILPATEYPRCTQTIDEIIEMIQGLIEKGFAYTVDGDVYFRVTEDDDYGRLSGRKIEDMQAGARIDVDGRKEHPMDFALWKSSKPGEPDWETPWGKGRPGWHIECSAMSMNLLGEQIDIHGGGNDLVFPHHENEIAQTESFTGKPFARYWMHNGMLQLAGEKMSKSLGNLVTIEEFLEKYDADILRLLIVGSNYRSPLTFSESVLEQTRKQYARLQSGLRPALPGAEGASTEALADLNEKMESTNGAFLEAMDDDFNSAGAMGHVFELVRLINQARDGGATDEQLQPSQQTMTVLTSLLGLKLGSEDAHGADADPFINLLVEVRKTMRDEKHWAMSDLIRDQLKDLGVLLEDSKGGSTWRWE